jgi:molecular chaperone GrpE
MRDARKYGGETVLHGLLPVLDNLERALQHATEDDGAISQGLKMVVKQFHDVFGTFGVQGFESLGQPFDPERHEAVGQTTETDAAPGTVIEEMLKGYFFHERLLRPARVIVAAAPAEDEAAEEPDAAEEADA